MSDIDSNQLINIIKGEMSFIGPRPFISAYLPLYSEFQLRRHETKPGFTGLAQINGRNSISWQKKFNYDVWYVENKSFILDLMILFKTFFILIKIKDVSQKDHPTCKPFEGN